MRSKTLALLLVAVIASGIVFAVSAQSQITAADIAKAILPGGFINPKAILPGAITSSHIANGEVKTPDIDDNAVTTYKILNETIRGEDIGEGQVNTTDILNETILGADIRNGEVNASDLSANAIPSVINNTAADDITIDTTPKEIVNDSISLPRDAKLIITYTGNVTGQTTTTTFVKINCSISNTTEAVREWYECKPGIITFADNAVNNVTVSVQFLNQTATTPAGDHYIRVMAWTTDGSAKINDNMLTVIALPA